MYTISKEFHFSAAHQLHHLSAEHQCARPHGHNYIVKVELSGDVGADGFVRDYGELLAVKRYIDEQLDHRDLNAVLGSSFATTAENLARELYDRFKAVVPELSAVSVSETPKTWATYRPNAAWPDSEPRDTVSTVRRAGEQPVYRVSWSEIESWTRSIADAVGALDRQQQPATVYGLPRGGLIPAVMLSHLLNLRLIVDAALIDDRTLLVDDINDSGGTLIDFLSSLDAKPLTAVLVRRSSTEFSDHIHGIIETGPDWYFFPWEIG